MALSAILCCRPGHGRRFSARRAALVELQFTALAHEASTAIYHQRPSELNASIKGYRLVELQQQCRPLHSEECWILFDPSHDSRVGTDVGRRHRPLNYSVFLITFHFGPVDIGRIDADANSVLTRSGPD
jgi:hypothetical protein